MRRLIGYSLLLAAFAAAPAFAQTPQTGPPTNASGEEFRPATTTVSGTTGLWFVPSASILPAKKWSASFYRTNVDDGQGFTDISTFPATFAVGLGNRAELFGAWSLITRIDRDTRPLFFNSSAAAAETGTGGGIVPDYPLVRSEWSGSKIGDFTVGGKLNFFRARDKNMNVGARVMLKLPTGDDESGVSSGKTDFIVDGIVSGGNPMVEVSGYGGFITRGNPDGFSLTDGFRWGIGAGFPQSYTKGLKFTAELFGENYFDTELTSPSGLVGTDGSPVPLVTFVKSPVIGALGITWQHRNGFFIGAAGSWNMNMQSRGDAEPSCADGAASCIANPYVDTSKDDKGFQVRLGFHPGAFTSARPRALPPPPPAPAPVVATPPPPAPNRPPTVQASCDPCTVQLGRTATVTATANDPDGNPLTYQWTATGGSLTSATNRQSPWTAPNQEGPVTFTVTVNDGRGGTASATTVIQVVRPPQQSFSFEDVHFEIDRFNLRPDALRVLDEAVTAMQANATLNLTIEGHTCNIGTAEYNLALGERRAQAVRDYLTSRGIAASRLQTVSFGEERPKYDNSREETRRMNRRAALVVRLQ